jgi:hypothetical protein
MQGVKAPFRAVFTETRIAKTGVEAEGAAVQALSFLRPRERRAAITLRPPTVAMRARKPWRRLRTILLG